MTTFTKLQTVAVPVTDQDKSKAFFEELGLTEHLDAVPQPGFRWIELALPGGGATVSLVAAEDDLPTGIDTGVRFLTADARAAHELLAAKGCEVGELLDWESAPLMFSFVDPDGNRFYVNQDH